MIGQRTRKQRAFGLDSSAYSSEMDEYHPYSHVNEIQSFHTKIPDNTEDSGFRQTMSTVRHSYRDAQELPYVAWPGPNVALDENGDEYEESGVNPVMFHGFFDGPMPGQKVAVAYMQGESNDPIVIQKYSSQSSGLVSSSSIFTTPFQRFNVSYKDVGLGHYTGAYIILRAETPLPGSIEVYSPNRIFVESEQGIEIVTPSDKREEIGDQWVIAVDSDSYTIEGSSATFDLKTTGRINIGNETNLEWAIKGETLVNKLVNLVDLFINNPITTDSVTGDESITVTLSAALNQWKTDIEQAKSTQTKIG